MAGISFQTRARTVDHLGREQIADTPTAVSELWKNAYDAYARMVELNIYDGSQPVAAVIDDGHGMNRDEFINKWLVVGTESKFSAEETPKEDRNGLPPRPRQGQKGIGRLSCANLGPLLLFVSKRRKSDFVAALIDWRLFENPYLNLSDIQLPVTEFAQKEDLFKKLPDLAKTLSENVTGASDKDRGSRLTQAWAAYDELQGDETSIPSAHLLETFKNLPFEERHLNDWPVWADKATHGTALVVGEPNYDLVVQLSEKQDDSSVSATKKRFFRTLSSFVDPFNAPEDLNLNETTPDFDYSVKKWKGDVSETIVGRNKQFSRRQIEPLEHCIEGVVDADGRFHGRVKAFGEILTEDCVIEPPKDLTLPNRADSRVGPFSIYVSTFEQEKKNTTHTDAEHELFVDLAKLYAGFMIFRDGLRVLPYGRPDNDFFEIETRRSISAGRHFWNHRRMFGRIAIARETNPNLRDKAGREGLLDNRAAKTFKDLVENILIQSAKRYFGSASETRQTKLPEIQEKNRERRATEDRNKLRQKQRKEFRVKLGRYTTELPEFLQEVMSFHDEIAIGDESEIVCAQDRLHELKEGLHEFRLPGAPKNLGVFEDRYKKFREAFHAAQLKLAELDQFIESEIERINPQNPEDLLKKQQARLANGLHKKIREWKTRIQQLQAAEAERITDLIDQRNKVFHAETEPLIQRFEAGQVDYRQAVKEMETIRQQLEADNEEIFPPYIGALESMSESIDLENLAIFGMEELSDLRSDVERLNSLAQLGIAVEITGHDLQHFDEMIGAGLRRLPEEVQKSKAVQDIELGYQGLTDQLRFLSPLRLAGQRIQKWINGDDIHSYLAEFFNSSLNNNKITLRASEDFKKFKVFDQQSRLFPVFINLINNSIYWLSLREMQNRQILLDVVGEEVVVSDNGPGVEPEDIENLFSLFFTKKIRGGRGVGLYLSRANLTAGGHRIRYETKTDEMPLPGANFVISFGGAEFDGK